MTCVAVSHVYGQRESTAYQLKHTIGQGAKCLMSILRKREGRFLTVLAERLRSVTLCPERGKVGRGANTQWATKPATRDGLYGVSPDHAETLVQQRREKEWGGQADHLKIAMNKNEVDSLGGV
ncbi:hypothetical protein ONS95_002358 [Cadophora gregata]|uniref:uncharacterized protein n=1 Tax=Cadophora gregata TaxID=51156 RepID=UPI0026DBB805|nr:uncharacterized protein ONS95_002358 [Cadophora gregata]KAK0109679.1 hypothetical protein ONS95_002358 [Cadophora gregata]KAK0110690.1 hypothetical protein ONS96_002292 [Cadophora gregata f. sp. sojae]